MVISKFYIRINCISLYFLQVEVKPYVLDDQLCDECQGARCGGKFAPFFCANVTCLQVKRNSFKMRAVAVFLNLMTKLTKPSIIACVCGHLL